MIRRIWKVIIVLYIILRLTGYFTPVDYKLNYIASHTDSKTTEIYTHVSTRNLQQIRSPFDDL